MSKKNMESTRELMGTREVTDYSIRTYVGNNANKTRIYKLSEMDADHVTAWSKGGATSMENCEMLCKTHNRSKGNR